MLYFFKKKTWPDVPFLEIKKRARLVVIDDEEFVYRELFANDGYAIDKWDDVEDLTKLEHGFYDIILLDMQGVGKKQSAEQGLGVLQHIRKSSPAQVVIAYSNAEFSLKYQEFFKLADETLSKGADYVEFKRKVDDLLLQRFSLGFYVNKLTSVIGGNLGDPEELEKRTKSAILNNSPGNLQSGVAALVQ